VDIYYIDVETTINNVGDEAVGGVGASPFHPDNHLVYLGVAKNDGEVEYFLNKDELEPHHDLLLVGHNIKFDLHYLNKHSSVKQWIGGGGRIWDTMVAEYVITGQESNLKTKGSLKLDSLCKKYGLPIKDDKIGEYFKAGMGADKIPKEEILPYLENDVRVTREIMQKQFEIAAEQNQLPLIYNMMDATLASWLMESEGCKLDGRAMGEDAAILTETVARNVRGLQMLCVEKCFLPYPHRHCINPLSDQQLSAILFGGVLKYKARVETGSVFRSGPRKGEKKTKIENIEKELEGFLPPAKWTTASKKGWKVDVNVMTEVANKAGGVAGVIARAVLDIRKDKKILSTYLVGYSSLIWHDGLLHPYYHTTLTDTGRLSCSAPNLQNTQTR
jgi:DNA polymerase I-like protein with 3'-5' exonuclease and polymerase domains